MGNKNFPVRRKIAPDWVVALPARAYDGQVITGESLKRARLASFMTQQAVADALQVALRTIGNWERGGSVPRKHWDAIRELLPKADEGALPEPEGSGITPELESRFMEDMRANSARFMSLREQGLSAADLAELQRKLYYGAIDSLDFVENAFRAGVATRLVREMAAAISSTVIDAGTVTILGQIEGFDPMGLIVFRAAKLDQEARDRPTEDRTIYGVEGMYAARNPGDVSAGSDTESRDEDEDFDVDVDVQKDMGLAAKRGERKVDQPHAE